MIYFEYSSIILNNIIILSTHMLAPQQQKKKFPIESRPPSNLTAQRQKQRTIEPTKKQKIPKEKGPSYWDQMITGIVRPPRAKYNTVQLGVKVVMAKDRIYDRSDFEVIHDGKLLQMTVYKPLETQLQTPYVILYMHGNSSCRLEAITLMKFLPPGVALASFDFMGCGRNSEIQTISLGYREAQQAKTICEFLRSKNYRVVLWGRSMGAATALLYGQAQFIVADSTFKSFKSLCKQVAKQHTPVPNFMINCFFPCVFHKIKNDVDRKAHYDVEDLDVKQAVKRLDPDTVIVFMSGDKDILIDKRNSQKLYNLCPCTKKYLKVFEGDHNSKRPQQVLNEVMSIIYQHVLNNQEVRIAISQ